MADYVEKWGDDIESAVELALRDIKLTREQVEIEVLEQPTKGFLGFHKKLAKVRVTKKAEPKPASGREESEAARGSESRREAPVKETAKEKKKDRPKPVKKFEKQFQRADVIQEEDAPEAPDAMETHREKKEHAKKAPKETQLHTKFAVSEEDANVIPANDAPAAVFIRNIAEKMGIDIQVKGDIIDDVLYIDMAGREVGALIGKRGQTLDSVQYLASIVQNKDTDKHYRVLVNAESYREKRERTLQQLAKKVADKCVKTGRNQKLEPMNPYERKVIHSALQSHPRVTTRSEGVEPTRRVVVELKR